MKIVYFFCTMLLATMLAFAQEKRYTVRTVAFYNFENLFDTINDASFDDEWTPDGLQTWTADKYQQKLGNLAKVLSQIGTNDLQKEAPALIGGCEIENRGVLEDLVKQPNFTTNDYGIIHFDSPDKRGIDVALLYRKKLFRPTTYVNIPLIIRSPTKLVNLKTDDESENIEYQNSDRIYTRDVLLVTGFLDDQEVNILVNHWPSRSGGEKKTSLFREEAGKLVRKTADSIYKLNPKAQIIIMGDFNDGPSNNSLKVKLGAESQRALVKPFGIFNPFAQMATEGHASLFYRDSGFIFDQILVSEPLINKDNSGFQFWKAGIYNKAFLIEKYGRYAGYPLRHSANEVGYSDHFPVYIYLIKEVK